MNGILDSVFGIKKTQEDFSQFTSAIPRIEAKAEQAATQIANLERVKLGLQFVSTFAVAAIAFTAIANCYNRRK